MVAPKDSGKVNIHGKEYETVASRVAKFRAKHGDKYGIVTEIISRTDDTVAMKALIIRYGEVLRDKDGSYTDSAVIATGYAEESRASSSINRTSALENAETSAIGRALANFGLAGTEYASADEVAQAISQRPATSPSVRPGAIRAAQRIEIYKLLEEIAPVPKAEWESWVSQRYDYDLKKLNHLTAEQLLNVLRRDAARNMEPTP